MTETHEREGRIAGILDEALQEFRRCGQIDLAGYQARYPDLATDLPGLFETLKNLDVTIDDCKGAQGPTKPEGAQPAEEAMPQQIGRYRILSRLGAGGMGTVWKAHDPQLDRVVALKVPRFDPSRPGHAALVQRFLREARAAAKVRHPHVCPIHDAGEHDGSPYAVMEYIEGSSLAELLRGNTLAVARAVELTRLVALALEAVHAQGIVHRDLKPGNVLLDANGSPYLTDFGLARAMSDEEHLTDEGVVVGTPAYLAPEQATGQTEQIGPATDVYSLGVMLYQMLTGRVPFTGTAMSILYQTTHTEPQSPRSLRPDLDAELETMVMKAMAKKPEQRYATAQAFAAALGTWRAPASLPTNESAASVPTHERREAKVTPLRRKWPWVAAAVLLAVTGALLIPEVIVRIRDKDGRTVEVKVPGDPKEIEVEKDGKVIKVPLDGGKKRPPPIVEVESMPLPGIKEGQPLNPAALVTRPAKLPGVQSWSIELREPRGPIYALGYSPDGRLMASGGEDRLLRLWDTTSGRLVAVLGGHRGRIASLSWSPDSRFVATTGTDSTMRVWEVASRCAVYIVAASPGLNCVAWSPDGKLLAYSTHEGVHLWNPAEGRSVRSFRAVGGSKSAAWAPDGKTLATSDYTENVVHLWDPQTGERRKTLRGHKQPISALAWSPDGHSLVTSSFDDKTLTWTPSGELLREFPVHAHDLQGLVFIPKLNSLAILGVSPVLDIFDLAGQRRKQVDLLGGIPTALTLSPDQRTIVLSTRRGAMIQIDPGSGEKTRILSDTKVDSIHLSWSPDGTTIVVGRREGDAKVWKPGMGLTLRRLGEVQHSAWSPGGELLAVISLEGRLELWDPFKLERITVLNTQDPAYCLAWSPDGQTLAAASNDKKVRLWSLKERKVVGLLDLPQEVRFNRNQFNLAWGDGGKVLGLGSIDACLWNVETGKVLETIKGNHNGYPTKILLAARGKRWALAFDIGTIGGKAESRIKDGYAASVGASWSPDGQSLAVSYGGGRSFGVLREPWEKVAPMGHEHAMNVVDGAWSPDGANFASAGVDGVVWVWNGSTQEPRMVWVDMPEDDFLTISADGHYSGSKGIEKHIVYIVQTDKGQETLTPQEFAKRYNWKNDPTRVRLTGK